MGLIFVDWDSDSTSNGLEEKSCCSWSWTSDHPGRSSKHYREIRIGLVSCSFHFLWTCGWSSSDGSTWSKDLFLEKLFLNVCEYDEQALQMLRLCLFVRVCMCVSHSPSLSRHISPLSLFSVCLSLFPSFLKINATTELPNAFTTSLSKVADRILSCTF